MNLDFVCNRNWKHLAVFRLDCGDIDANIQGIKIHSCTRACNLRVTLCVISSGPTWRLIKMSVSLLKRDTGTFKIFGHCTKIILKKYSEQLTRSSATLREFGQKGLAANNVLKGCLYSEPCGISWGLSLFDDHCLFSAFFTAF